MTPFRATDYANRLETYFSQIEVVANKLPEGSGLDSSIVGHAIFISARGPVDSTIHCRSYTEARRALSVVCADGQEATFQAPSRQRQV